MVRFDGYRTNLHRIWDGLGLMKRMRRVSADRRGEAWREGEVEGAAAETPLHDLMSDYHAYLTALLGSDRYAHRVPTWLACPDTSVDPRYGCPETWARDVSPLNCAYTWTDVVPEGTLPPEYWARIERDLVLEELVLKAAVRLAAVLNSVFDATESEGHVLL